MKQPSIVIIGAGAIGCAVAAALSEAGHHPRMASRQPVTRVRRELQGESTSFSLGALSPTDPREAVDWILLCTKAYQSEDASAWFDGLVGADTTLAVLQNGVDHAERLSRYIASHRILPVVVQMAAERTGPGAITQTRPGQLFFPDTDLGRRFARLGEGARAIDFTAEADFVSALWRKLVANATTGSFCALTLRQNAVFAAPQVHEQAAAYMREVMAVGRAEGASFPDDYIDEMLARISGPVGEHWTSMAADRRDGNPMEWEVRNAVVSELGRRHGIPTPLNDLLTALLSEAR